MKKELVFLRAFAITTVIGMFFITTSAFKNNQNQKFNEIDVERINIVEKDGTVRMIITNEGLFPNGKDIVNGRSINENRKKRSGMLFFNEEGIECGGFIYDGRKTKDGHSSGLSLTYDQYDGDQVMQLLTEDYQKGDKRFVSSSLAFTDRSSKETQQKNADIMKELEELKKKDPKAMREKYKQYTAQGYLGTVPRVILGKTTDQNNGLFLFDKNGAPRAMFYVDKDNKAKLDFYDDKGNTIASLPDEK